MPKQTIKIELSSEEWREAVANYLGIGVEEIESMDHSSMELSVTRPLDVKDSSENLLTLYGKKV